jgi:hypothetical protein
MVHVYTKKESTPSNEAHPHTETQNDITVPTDPTHTNQQTRKPTDKQANKQTNKQTINQTNNQVNIQTFEHLPLPVHKLSTNVIQTMFSLQMNAGNKRPAMALTPPPAISQEQSPTVLPFTAEVSTTTASPCATGTAAVSASSTPAVGGAAVAAVAAAAAAVVDSAMEPEREDQGEEGEGAETRKKRKLTSKYLGVVSTYLPYLNTHHMRFIYEFV